jgi:hypothetical protein
MSRAGCFIQWMCVAAACALSPAAWAQSSTQGYTPPARDKAAPPSGTGQSRLPLADPSQFSDNPGDTRGQSPGAPGVSSGNSGAANAGGKPAERREPDNRK